jgi:uncharacterized membrane protein YtjA (UPF0391 family)
MDRHSRDADRIARNGSHSPAISLTVDEAYSDPSVLLPVCGYWPLARDRLKQSRSQERKPAFNSDTRDLDSLQGGFMLRWALAFFVVALIAAVFGFLGIAVAAASIARILFFIFLALFLVSLVGGLVRRA